MTELSDSELLEIHSEYIKKYHYDPINNISDNQFSFEEVTEEILKRMGD